MSTPGTTYQSTGRVEQKRRTRDALVQAARDLVSDGVTPTVESAASAAAVSRTTAYRYFPNQRDLLLAAHPETGARSLLPVPPPESVPARLDAVVRAFTDLIVATEPQQRTMLWMSLDASTDKGAPLPLRQGRAIGWIQEALAPLGDTMSAAEVLALTHAVRSAIGIEALVWLVDVAGLSRDDAADLMRWTARALLRAAASDLPPPTPTPDG